MTIAIGTSFAATAQNVDVTMYIYLVTEGAREESKQWQGPSII